MCKMVSVIIPVYNTEQYIKTCYLSVINQSYSPIEIILIDDASTDNSKKIIQELKQKTNNRMIRCYYFSENRGLSDVRNFGLEKSSGEYVAFLDSDDWYDSNFLAEMVDALEKNHADVSICSILSEKNNFSSSSIRYFYNTTTSITGDYALKLLSRSIRNDVYITPMVGNKLFRKNFLVDNKLQFIQRSCYEDDVFSFSLFALDPSVILVSKTAQHYLQREDSITHSFSKKRIDDLINAFIILKNNLQEYGIFNKYEKEYMAYFDRCISTTYQCLDNVAISTHEKKQYITYFLEKLLASFSLKNIVDYLDFDRFDRFWG